MPVCVGMMLIGPTGSRPFYRGRHKGSVVASLRQSVGPPTALCEISLAHPPEAEHLKRGVLEGRSEVERRQSPTLGGGGARFWL